MRELKLTERQALAVQAIVRRDVEMYEGLIAHGDMDPEGQREYKVLRNVLKKLEVK